MFYNLFYCLTNGDRETNEKRACHNIYKNDNTPYFKWWHNLLQAITFDIYVPVKHVSQLFFYKLIDNSVNIFPGKRL